MTRVRVPTCDAVRCGVRAAQLWAVGRSLHQDSHTGAWTLDCALPSGLPVPWPLPRAEAWNSPRASTTPTRRGEVEAAEGARGRHRAHFRVGVARSGVRCMRARPPLARSRRPHLSRDSLDLHLASALRRLARSPARVNSPSPHEANQSPHSARRRVNLVSSSQYRRPPPPFCPPPGAPYVMERLPLACGGGGRFAPCPPAPPGTPPPPPLPLCEGPPRGGTGGAP